MEKANEFKLTEDEIKQISPSTAYNINIGLIYLFISF